MREQRAHLRGDRAAELGSVRSDAERRAPRPHRRDLLERSAAKHRAERAHELRRRLLAAVDLELEPGALAWQLQLPDAVALFDPAAQRHSGTAKPRIARVVLEGP
jgi:hypothetical protein